MCEVWIEVRCIRCVPLGWYHSRLLMRVRGQVVAQEVYLELKCPRCGSIIEWTYGKPEFKIVKDGVKNHKRQLVAFE